MNQGQFLVSAKDPEKQLAIALPNYVNIFTESRFRFVDWKWSDYQSGYGSVLFPNWIPHLRTYSKDYVMWQLQSGNSTIVRDNITLPEIFETWYADYERALSHLSVVIGEDESIRDSRAIDQVIGNLVLLLKNESFYDQGYIATFMELQENTSRMKYIRMSQENYAYNTRDMLQLGKLTVFDIVQFRTIFMAYIIARRRFGYQPNNNIVVME